MLYLLAYRKMKLVSDCYTAVFLHFPGFIQSNLNNSSTDGSFTTADLNSFLSPYENLPIAQGN